MVTFQILDFLLSVKIENMVDTRTELLRLSLFQLVRCQRGLTYKTHFDALRYEYLHNELKSTPAIQYRTVRIAAHHGLL